MRLWPEGTAAGGDTSSPPQPLVRGHEQGVDGFWLAWSQSNKSRTPMETPAADAHGEALRPDR